MNNEQTVFLNGRAQIVEMLQHMDPNHKETLLRNIKQRNPTLAIELVEKSITFENINLLSTHELKILLNYVKAPIMAMALKSVSQQLQRRVLSIASREYAEEAYKIMIKPLQNEEINVKKARSRVLEILVTLYKKKQIIMTQ